MKTLHGHAALFGVYGMLGIGLMLFCLRVPGDIVFAAGSVSLALSALCALWLLRRPARQQLPAGAVVETR
jgi:nitric oxide reductase subunit B